MKSARGYIVLAHVAVAVSITFHALQSARIRAHALLRLSICYVTLGSMHIPISELKTVTFLSGSNFGSVLMNVTFDLTNEWVNRQSRKKINKRCRRHHRVTTATEIVPTNEARKKNKLVYKMMIVTVSWSLLCLFSSFGLFFPISNWLFKDHDLIGWDPNSVCFGCWRAKRMQTSLSHTRATRHTRGCGKHIHASYGTHHSDAFRTQTDTI